MNNLSKTDQNQGKILKIKLTSKPKEEVLKDVETLLSEAKKFYITTPNPEIAVKAYSDCELLEILNSAEFSLPDGFGLAVAHKFLKLEKTRNKVLAVPYYILQWLFVLVSIPVKKNRAGDRLEIIRGRDFMIDLFILADKKSYKVYLLGGYPEVVNSESVKKINQEFKNIKVSGSSGPMLDKEANPVSEVDSCTQKEVLRDINNFRPDILIVALGAPKQEKWVNKNLSRLNVKCTMVVGGALDYYSGYKKLPPKWMEEWGLEWLWRLILEPSRIKRILNAVFVFPALVIKSKMDLLQKGS